MRTFTDQAGRCWDVAVERASWGAFLLVFAERHGPGARHIVLGSRSIFEASHELAQLTEEDLRAQLARAEPLV